MATTELNITLLTTSQSNKETTINDALQRIEQATQGYFDLDLTGETTYTFVSDWYENFLFDGSGNSANVTFTLASTARFFAMKNSSAYDYIMTFDGSTAAYTILAGEAFLFYSTGTELIVLTQYIGSVETTVVTETTTLRTLSVTDANKYIRTTNASPVTITVPANSTEAIPVGSTILINQNGVGQVTLSAAGGVTINTPETLLIRAQYSTIALIKVDTDEWDLSGDLEAA